ncbi:MAG: alpha/beta hydrolase [Bacilli bacterium]|nr:alpha/beta hydrolase [Bacilli bacterium]
MKLGKFLIKFFNKLSDDETKKRRKHYPPHGEFEETINIPYIEGDYNPQHSFDVYLANDNRNNICLIDIHGGAYIFGEHKDNWPFCYNFAKQGFDVVNVDYKTNDGTRSVKDSINDIVKCLNYVYEHRKELGLAKDKFVITGDSAGGHFALTLAELFGDEKYASKLGYKTPNMDVLAVLVNCPVYDFANLKDENFTEAGAKRMFGPKYKNKNYFVDICPKTHLKSLHMPLFVSTCTQDFIRKQSLMLIADMKKREDIKFSHIDIKSKKKDIGHVHNVLLPKLAESQQVNDAMRDFILEINR